MNRRVVLRPEVPDDLRSIIQQLEQNSAAVADRFIESAFETWDGLSAAPGKG